MNFRLTRHDLTQLTCGEEDVSLAAVLDAFLETHKVVFTHEMLASLQLKTADLSAIHQETTNDRVREVITIAFQHGNSLARERQISYRETARVNSRILNLV